MLLVFWKIHSGRIGCKCVVNLGFSRFNRAIVGKEKTVRFVNVNNVLFLYISFRKRVD